MSFLRRPQQVWLRKANFQIHLWAGVVLALYVTVIGVTGTILVFGAELSARANPSPWPALRPDQPMADLSVVIANVAAAYPLTHIISVMAPTHDAPVFLAVLPLHGRTTIACDAITGRVTEEVPRRESKLDWIYDLHENLLAHRTGRVVNGSAALSLLLLAFTGMVNWWPGVQRWRQALVVDFRRRWRRVNFDLHSAVGFWSVLFVVMWALTGVYFTWPAKVFAMVDRLSPVVNSRPPVVTVDPNTEMQQPDFREMLKKARAVDPEAEWKGIIFPSSRRSPFEMLMSRSRGVGRDYEDTLYFNPYNGKYISNWRYGVNQSLGDWVIWLQIPLHFGTHWGWGVKVLWAAFGLALPTLAVTGLLMYWNRVLSKKWNASFSRTSSVARP